MIDVFEDNEPFVWRAEVRGYEVDLQGIVNNAVYLNYLDQTRVLYFKSKGIDWEAWHHQGYNLVVSHMDISFKRSLRQYDHFYVSTTIQREGRLKILFHQTIFKADQSVIVKAIVTCVCVSIATGKPVASTHLLKS